MNNEKTNNRNPFGIPGWAYAAETGYKPKTTFWQDFWIAAHYGPEAVLDTYRRAFDGWKADHEYLTEMALVLNHIGWELWNSKRALATTFFELGEMLDGWCRANFTKEQKEYYFRITD